MLTKGERHTDIAVRNSSQAIIAYFAGRSNYSFDIETYLTRYAIVCSGVASLASEYGAMLAFVGRSHIVASNA